jgi:type I restriction enzyme M protein
VKKELLENFNLHTIVSLPAGVFLPYAGVKTNFILFDRTGSTSEIWYYEVNPPYKLTKNKPISSEHFQEFTELFEKRASSANSWIIKVSDIKDYDLSAKNPNKQQDIEHLPPAEILAKLKANDTEISDLLNEIEQIMGEGYE